MKPKILAFAVALTVATNLSAQTFTILHDFSWSDGAYPGAGLILSGNTLFGTASEGGSSGNGTVFKVNTDGSGFTTLHNFSGSDGGESYAGLILSGNTLYGTAYYGGSSSDGTVFKVNTDGTGFATLHSFTNGSDGAYPEGGLILSGNTLYGTTSGGGTNGQGTVFAVNTDGSGFTTLHNFSGSDGGESYAGLILSGNTLYGTTSIGGTNGQGTVFAVNTDGSGFTTLHNFSWSDGSTSYAGLILSGNTLYGTTSGGGTNGQGTVFAVNTDGSGFTTLHNFSGNDGGGSYAGLILSGNTLYGTTSAGGTTGNGTVFAVNTDGSGFTILHSFFFYKVQDGASPWAGGASPWAGLVLSGNTLYGTTYFDWGSTPGTVFALSLSATPPIITTQPQSQTVPSGSNVTFTVAASVYPPPNYQWQFNGQNIPNATNATLTLNSVTAANSGGYSVVVSNPYGSVTSATASLAVLDDGANGNTPTQIIFPTAPTPSAGVDSLIVVTHGWEPLQPNADLSWVTNMCNAIRAKVPSNWLVTNIIWLQDATFPEPDIVLEAARTVGTGYGQQLSQQNWKHVHLIGHSAGSRLIQAIADQLASSPTPTVQLTFLDPYLGSFLQDQDIYGRNASYADCYFSQDYTGGDTSGDLPNAYNADVDWVDPNYYLLPFGSTFVAFATHGYPIDFYMQTITNTDPNWCAAGYGFALSAEDGGANSQLNHPVGNDNNPDVLCGPPGAIPTPTFPLVLSDIVIGDAAYAVSDTASAIVNGAGFLLNSISSALPLVKSNGVHPLGQTDSTDTPAWLAVGVSVTNAINFVQFDAAFTDTNSAQGLLTVYWNTNQIGMVDERVAATNSQTYRFELPGTVSGGLYTLSFRLDSFDNDSSIAVTNVATGFVGATQPITLGISVTNGVPLLQLTAATNFTYLIQTSTNLVDWTPTALLLNTNGTAQFLDSAVTNSGTRFYRAVMQ